MVGRPQPLWFPSNPAFLRRGPHSWMIPFGSEVQQHPEGVVSLRSRSTAEHHAVRGRIEFHRGWMHPIWDSPRRIPYFPRSTGYSGRMLGGFPRKTILRPAKPGCFDLGYDLSRGRDPEIHPDPFIRGPVSVRRPGVIEETDRRLSYVMKVDLPEGVSDHQFERSRRRFRARRYG
jgi:hypothetical protein